MGYEARDGHGLNRGVWAAWFRAITHGLFMALVLWGGVTVWSGFQPEFAAGHLTEFLYLVGLTYALGVYQGATT